MVLDANVSPALEYAYRLMTAIQRYRLPDGKLIENDTKAIEDLLDEGAENEYAWFQDNQGRSPLHHAALIGHDAIVRLLLQAGHPWNALDDERKTAAELAFENGHQQVYDFLVQEGVRSELILNVLHCKNKRAMVRMDGETKELTSETTHYLSREVQYTGSDQTLVDDEQNGVMMRWEWPLMKRHAQMMCGVEDEPLVLEPTGQMVPRKELLEGCGLSIDASVEDETAEMETFCVLNVGFGLGIVDSYIHQYLALKQRQNPDVQYVHYIIEAHPTVQKRMSELGWVDEKHLMGKRVNRPILRVLACRWQEAVEQLYEEGAQLDSMFFDTFGEDYHDMREWHDHLPNLLKSEPTSLYTFFNGLGATNKVFHEVYCRVVEMDMQELGFKTEWELVPIDTGDGAAWEGIKWKYYTLDTYRLPVFRFDYGC